MEPNATVETEWGFMEPQKKPCGAELSCITPINETVWDCMGPNEVY